MNTHVNGETPALRKPRIALGACVWALTTMHTLVNSEKAAGRTSIIAFVASMRALSSIHVHKRATIGSDIQRIL